MKHNFKCPKTGKKFHISRHRAVQKADGWDYKDGNGRILTNPDNGEILVPIKRKGPIGIPTVHKPMSERLQRNSDYAAKRSREHGQSNEAKEERKKHLTREINTAKGKM